MQKRGSPISYQTGEEQPQTPSDNFICKNPSCRRTFSKPLKTSDLKQKPQIPYYACPYCLTEITLNETQTATDQATASNILEKLGKSSACKHYVGYLSERTTKEAVPDECLLCNVLVQCMLKKSKSL